MKKRKTYRWLFVYPFQYVGFQKYLNQKANKGWKLVSVFGNNSCWLTFERTEDKDYYVVDYTKDFSMISPETETEKAKRYRSFIEEYGYEYVGSNGALQIYRTTQDNEMLRENNEEDHKTLLKSSLKSLALNLFLFVLSIVNIYKSSLQMKSELYCSNVAIISKFLFLILAVMLLMEYVSFLYWLCRKKPISSQNIIIYASILFTLFLGLSIIALLSLMTSPYILIIVFFVVICSYGIFQIIRNNRKKGKEEKYILCISIIVTIVLTCLVGSRIMVPTLNNVENDKSEVNEELSRIFEIDSTNIYSYEEKSILSQNLSIHITYPEDNYISINRYKIQDGIFADWVRKQYEKDEFRNVMCPGINDGTYRNDKWIYEGDDSVLIVDGNIYLIVDKSFVFDDAGWKKMNQLIDL